MDNSGNPKVDVVLARGIVQSTNPGQILARVNVTNTGSTSLQSLKLNETLPVDSKVDPAWMPALCAIHVYYANTTSLATSPEITQPSTITVSTGNPEVVHLAISDLTAIPIGHPSIPGQSILLSVKLTYGLIKTASQAIRATMLTPRVLQPGPSQLIRALKPLPQAQHSSSHMPNFSAM